MEPEPMNTVSQVMNKLKVEGYEVDFNLKKKHLECSGNDLKIYPGEFKVDQIYRFEGTSDPGDEAIVYAITSDKHNIKGILVNAYGVYSEELTDEMEKALDIKT